MSPTSYQTAPPRISKGGIIVNKFETAIAESSVFAAYRALLAAGEAPNGRAQGDE